MGFKTLHSCIQFLKSKNELYSVSDPVSSDLEMAAIHLEIFKNKGPALLFENITNCKYHAVSNLFGTKNRASLIFNDTLNKIPELIKLKNNPALILNKLSLLKNLKNAIPSKEKFTPSDWEEISIQDLPQIKCWPMDGGAFITLPLVYSEDITNPGIKKSNLGMYRIQLSGNSYKPGKEIGLHYQIHRGIGVHQYLAKKHNTDLKVSVFIGGPPALTLSAVMPLPEGLSEIMFAGVLGNHRIPYSYCNGFGIINSCDFVITGYLRNNIVKPEGPFGDHLGYYSLQHNFPILEIEKVFAKKNAIWPFTVVGKPPQEDTIFGELIHEMTGIALENEIPGLKEVNAVDAAGVHPLLLAVGSERYTPYAEQQKPQELLTIANHILGSGQLSLAKYLFIAEENKNLSVKNCKEFIEYFIERCNWERDLHFQTNTTIDTLDYSGTSLNSGSKLILVCGKNKIKNLSNTPPAISHQLVKNSGLIAPGILAIEVVPFTNYENAENDIAALNTLAIDYSQFPLIIITDDVNFITHSYENFLWSCFTKSNPSHDVYGIHSFTIKKHWGCKGSLIIDARKKPHHAPELISNAEVQQNVKPIIEKILNR